MESKNDLNPLRMWREWLVKSEKMWSDGLTDIMGDERFSKGAGRYMQEMLHSHRMFTDAFAQYLSALNLPSRADILDISDRLGQVEDALAQLQAEIGEQRSAIQKLSGGDASAEKRPSRTKQPPKPKQ
jgi:hypothetical protein